MKPEGNMIILDMEPLLHAEQYAVPYNNGELITLLHNLGWVATSQVIPHKFVMLYAIRAKKIGTNEISENQICEAIEQLWKQTY